MSFTKDQLALIHSESPEVVFKLEGIEVLGIYNLGQMHQKVVRLTDNFFGNTKVGVFSIDEFNGQNEVDFTNPDEWTDVKFESIKFSLKGPTKWGSFEDEYQNITHIQLIELLEK